MNGIIRIISFHCWAPIFKWYTVTSWITRIHFILKINNIKHCSSKLPITIVRILHTSNLLIFLIEKCIIFCHTNILSSWTFFLLSTEVVIGSDVKIGTSKQSISYKSMWHVFRNNDFLPNCPHDWSEKKDWI